MPDENRQRGRVAREGNGASHGTSLGPYVLIDFYSQWSHKGFLKREGICEPITGLQVHSSNDVRDRLRQSR